MESFLSRRANDPRFTNERRVPGGSSWYAQPSRPTVVEMHTFSASNYETSPKMSDEKPKKKKKRKSGEAFTESEKKKLEDRTSSDDSDGGVCWSDYERDPSKPAGTKGSCRPKKKKSGD